MSNIVELRELPVHDLLDRGYDVDYEWLVSVIPPAIVGGLILAIGMYGVHRLIEYIIDKTE